MLPHVSGSRFLADGHGGTAVRFFDSSLEPQRALQPAEETLILLAADQAWRVIRKLG